VINLDKLSPDFKGDYNKGPNGFESNHVFDFAHFHVQENYQKILTDADVTDAAGAELPKNLFEMEDNFQLIFCLSSATEEDFNATIAKIPQSENMNKYKVV